MCPKEETITVVRLKAFYNPAQWQRLGLKTKKAKNKNMFKDKDNNYRLKIAFDFDGTLTEPDVFLFAQRLIQCGHDVWIMTARIESDDEYIEQRDFFGVFTEEDVSTRNADLFKIAEELGVPRDKIIFANLESKSDAYFKHGFDLLFDDHSEWHCNPICENGGVAVKI